MMTTATIHLVMLMIMMAIMIMMMTKKPDDDAVSRGGGGSDNDDDDCDYVNWRFWKRCCVVFWIVLYWDSVYKCLSFVRILQRHSIYGFVPCILSLLDNRNKQR